jgi:hypothetical protein
MITFSKYPNATEIETIAARLNCPEKYDFAAMAISARWRRNIAHSVPRKRSVIHTF